MLRVRLNREANRLEIWLAGEDPSNDLTFEVKDEIQLQAGEFPITAEADRLGWVRFVSVGNLVGLLDRIADDVVQDKLRSKMGEF